MLSAHDRKYLTPADQQEIKRLTDLYSSCIDIETAVLIHNKAEDIREKYGYSGGANGSSFVYIKGAALDSRA